MTAKAITGASMLGIFAAAGYENANVQTVGVLAAIGALVWFLQHTVQVTLPETQKSFNSAMEKQENIFVLAMKESKNDFLVALKEQRQDHKDAARYENEQNRKAMDKVSMALEGVANETRTNTIAIQEMTAAYRGDELDRRKGAPDERGK